MAVKKVNTYLYVGLAADAKPTNPPDGAKFLSTDVAGLWLAVDGTWIQLVGTTVAVSI